MTGLNEKDFSVGKFLPKTLQTKVSRFSRKESGATAVEYALIIGLITVLIFGAVQVLGDGIQTQIGKATCAIKGGTATTSQTTSNGVTKTTVTCPV